MNELRYAAVVKDGSLRITDRKGFDQDMKAMEGLKLTLRIKKWHKTRSDKQNGFYWGNFVQAEIDIFWELWGERYRTDQVHEWNKLYFFGEQRVIETTGEMVFTPSSSADKSTVEWEESLERCREWFRQNLDRELPFPEQQSKMYDNV